MKVLVCGSRNYGWVKKLRGWAANFSEIDRFNDTLAGYTISKIIAGGAEGADTLAETYAKQRQIPLEIYPAQWSKHGKSAGPIRNKQMLDEGKPEMVIAFPHPDSIGTHDMIRQAQKAGVKTIVIQG